MAYLDGLIVQVAERGQTYASTDSDFWHPLDTGTTNSLRSVAFLSNRLLITGENGTVLYADTLDQIRPGSLPTVTSNWLEGVAASASIAVAVGDNASIYSSSDGVAWTQRPAPVGTTAWLRSVAYGPVNGGIFVAVGEGGTILYTTSLQPLTIAKVFTSGTTANLNRVRYLQTLLGNYFMAVGDSGVALRSTDGKNWAAETGIGATGNLYDVAANSISRVLLGDGEVRLKDNNIGSSWVSQIALGTNGPPTWNYLSAVGVSNYFLIAGRTGLNSELFRTGIGAATSWTTDLPLPRNWLWNITHQAGNYYAAGDLNTILSSANGVDWARETITSTATNGVLLGIGGNSNLLVTVGNGGQIHSSHAGFTNVTITNIVGTNIVVTNQSVSTYGVVWIPRSSGLTNDLQGVVASSNLVVATGDDGAILTSDNGIDWTRRNAPTNRFLASVESFPGGWVTCGESGCIATSVDGVSWTARSLGTTNWMSRVRNVGGSLVSVGQNGSVFTSADGTNWTQRLTGTTRWLNDITFVDNTWFIVGNQGTLLTSTNLAAWTPQPIATGKSLYCAATAGGQLIAAGIEGIILRSWPKPQTNSVDIAQFSFGHQTTVSFLPFTTNITSQNFYFLAGSIDQRFQLQSSTNLTTWKTNATLEFYDSSATLFFLENRALTNTPSTEFYRTKLVP